MMLNNSNFRLMLLLFITICSCAPKNTVFKERANKKRFGDPYKMLIDANSPLVYGSDCWKSGRQTQGSIAINKLLKAKKFTKIKKILDGHNTVGKVFAIEALLELAICEKIELSNIEKAKIKTIIRSNEIIYLCRGCLKTTIGLEELFNQSKFKKMLKENGISIKN